MRSFCFFFLTLFFSEAFAEPYIINLNDKKITWLGETDFYVEKVLVTQDEKDCIGFVQEAINHTKAAYFNHTISEELLLLFGRTFVKKENSRAITVRVNSFFVNELNNMSSFELNFDIITFQDSLCIIEFSSGIIERMQGLGDKKILSNILSAFEKSFNEYNNRRQNNKLILSSIPKDFAYTDSLFSVSFTNTFNKRQAQKGIYKTYNDFRNNTTDTAYAFNIVEKDYSSAGKAAKMKFTANEPYYEPWGFTDGTNHYINVNSQDRFYIPLQQYYNSNEFFTYYIMPKDYSGGVIIGATIGGAIIGAIGGLIYAAIVSAQPGNEVELVLDLSTGKLKSDEFEEKSLLQNSIVFCHSKNSNSANGIILQYDNNKSVTIPSNSYYILKKIPTRETFKVEVLSGDGENTYAGIDLNNMEKKIYLIDQNKRGTIKIDELYDYMKSDYLNKLKFMQQIK